jgi:hypothetical protein
MNTTWFSMSLTESQRQFLLRLEREKIDAESIVLLARHWDWENRCGVDRFRR